MKQHFDDFQGVRFLAAALLAIAAVLAVSACGSGDSSTSGRSTSEGTTASATAITKAQLIKKADAICRKTDEIQKKGFNTFSVKNEVILGNNPEMRKAMKTILLPPIQVELEEIAALGVPAGDEAKLATMMAGWERALHAALKDPTVLITGGEGLFDKSDKLAGEYGFRECDKVY